MQEGTSADRDRQVRRVLWMEAAANGTVLLGGNALGAVEPHQITDPLNRRIAIGFNLFMRLQVGDDRVFYIDLGL
jgi:hypothetical protein